MNEYPISLKKIASLANELFPGLVLEGQYAREEQTFKVPLSTDVREQVKGNASDQGTIDPILEGVHRLRNMIPMAGPFPADAILAEIAKLPDGLPEFDYLKKIAHPGILNDRERESFFRILRKSDDSQKISALLSMMSQKATDIMAAPGSGKTELLIETVAHVSIINREKRTKLLTFSRAAAQTLKKKLKKNGIDSEDVWVGTVHSLCLKILKDHGDSSLGFNPHQKGFILDEHGQLRVIKTILTELGYAFDIEPEDIVAWLNREYNTPQGRSMLPRVRKAIERYVSYKRANKVLDYNDLITEALALIARRPALADRLKSSVQYLFVDESQDTANKQYEVIAHFINPDGHTTFVGDGDQTLYRFQGAALEVLRRFRTEHGAVQRKLETTFRSSGNIVKAYNHVIEGIKDRASKHIKATFEVPYKVVIVLSETPEAEAAAIQAAVQQLQSNFDVPLPEVTALTRTNDQGRCLVKLLKSKGVPCHYVQSGRIKDSRHARFTAAILRIATGCADIDIEQTTIDLLAGECPTLLPKIKGQEQVWYPGNLLIAISQYEGAGLSDVDMKLGKCLKEVAGILPTPNIDLTALRNQLRNIACDIFAEEQMTRLEQVFDEVWRAIQRSQLKDPETPLPEHCKRVLDSEDDTFDAMTVRTIHQSKALTFDAVFVSGMELGMIPHHIAIEEGTATALGDERRILFVGMSRPRKFLFLCYSKKRYVNGNVRSNLEMSPYLDELMAQGRDFLDIIPAEGLGEYLDFMKRGNT